MAVPSVPEVMLEPVEVEVGHWCNDCFLSTGMRLWLAQTQHGEMVLTDGFGCHECGGTDITATDT